jgi:hypothetical protein
METVHGKSLAFIYINQSKSSAIKIHIQRVPSCIKPTFLLYIFPVLWTCITIVMFVHFLLWRTYCLPTDTFVRRSFKVCWLTNNTSHIMCRYVYYLSTCKISHIHKIVIRQIYTLSYLLFSKSILKIAQHVSNYVTVHLQGLNCLLHQLYTYGTH